MFELRFTYKFGDGIDEELQKEIIDLLFQCRLWEIPELISVHIARQTLTLRMSKNIVIEEPITIRLKDRIGNELFKNGNVLAIHSSPVGLKIIYIPIIHRRKAAR